MKQYAPAHAAPHLSSHHDDPARWLGSTRLLDLEDPKLRLRVRSLTQLCKNEREKALAVYGFVKRMPLVKRFKLRFRTARQVIEAGRGDAVDKATLLVAMLRAAHVPARVHYVRLRGEILQGLTTRVRQPMRALVEAWLHGRWLRTDTYIFDAAYMAAARQRLKEDGWTCGYGIHVAGAMLWDGFEDAFVGGLPTAEDPMVLADLGTWHEVDDFTSSSAYRDQHLPLARLWHLNLLSPQVQRGIRRLRKDRAPSGPATGRKLS